MGCRRQRLSITRSFIAASGGWTRAIVRLSNPFGPGQDIRGSIGAASIFAARALAGERIEIWGDGSAIRDYVYVDDAISGLLATVSVPVMALGVWTRWSISVRDEVSRCGSSFLC